MSHPSPTLLGVTLKSAVVHTVTYFVVGWLAYTFVDYSAKYADPNLKMYMRQTTDPWVMAGPLFQPLRGVLFGLIFYLLRDVVFAKKNGWLILWCVLVIAGILSTFGPSPGSIEGILYTIVPLPLHLMGLPEVLLQSFLLSAIVYYWVNHPEKRWLTWLMVALFVVVMLLPILGLFASGRVAPGN